MYDVIVVGAGPSGSTLARLLNRNYKILLIDKRELGNLESPNGLEKCCGGLLAPDAQYMLAKLGLGVPKHVLLGPQLFTVRTIDLDNSLERFYQRNYINVDREKFDRWLVSLLPGNITTMFGCHYRLFEETEECIKVTYKKEGQDYQAFTRVLIGADGANSIIRRHSMPNQAYPNLYIAIQEWYETEKASPYFSSIFDREITDFYSWTIPKEDYLIVGSAIPVGQEVNNKFELLKEKLSKYGFCFKRRVKRNGAFIYRTTNLKQIQYGRNNVALIGEAAGWISPSSAEGISYSMKSALALAQGLNKSLTEFGQIYKYRTRNLRHNIVLKNLKSPAMYNKVIRNLVMKSGLLSMKVVE